MVISSTNGGEAIWTSSILSVSFLSLHKKLVPSNSTTAIAVEIDKCDSSVTVRPSVTVPFPLGMTTPMTIRTYIDASIAESNSELTRHIQIGYYWVKDLIDRGLITVEYCPTESMIADSFTKPIHFKVPYSTKWKIKLSAHPLYVSLSYYKSYKNLY